MHSVQPEKAVLLLWDGAVRRCHPTPLTHGVVEAAVSLRFSAVSAVQTEGRGVPPAVTVDASVSPQSHQL